MGGVLWYTGLGRPPEEGESQACVMWEELCQADRAVPERRAVPGVARVGMADLRSARVREEVAERQRHAGGRQGFG